MSNTAVSDDKTPFGRVRHLNNNSSDQQMSQPHSPRSPRSPPSPRSPSTHIMELRTRKQPDTADQYGWTKQEDESLKQGVSIYGDDCVSIKKHMARAKTVPEIRERIKLLGLVPSPPKRKVKKEKKVKQEEENEIRVKIEDEEPDVSKIDTSSIKPSLIKSRLESLQTEKKVVKVTRSPITRSRTNVKSIAAKFSKDNELFQPSNSVTTKKASSKIQETARKLQRQSKQKADPLNINAFTPSRKAAFKAQRVSGPNKLNRSKLSQLIASANMQAAAYGKATGSIDAEFAVNPESLSFGSKIASFETIGEKAKTTSTRPRIVPTTFVSERVKIFQNIGESEEDDKVVKEEESEDEITNVAKRVHIHDQLEVFHFPEVLEITNESHSTPKKSALKEKSHKESGTKARKRNVSKKELAEAESENENTANASNFKPISPATVNDDPVPNESQILTTPERASMSLSDRANFIRNSAKAARARTDSPSRKSRSLWKPRDDPPSPSPRRKRLTSGGQETHEEWQLSLSDSVLMGESTKPVNGGSIRKRRRTREEDEELVKEDETSRKIRKRRLFESSDDDETNRSQVAQHRTPERITKGSKGRTPNSTKRGRRANKVQDDMKEIEENAVKAVEIHTETVPRKPFDFDLTETIINSDKDQETVTYPAAIEENLEEWSEDETTENNVEKEGAKDDKSKCVIQ